MKKLNIIFAGTEYFSAKHLHALIDSPHHVILTISQPDQPSGRGQKTNFSPVKILSKSHNIPIVQPLNLNEEKFQHYLLKLDADIMIVVAYGKIIPQKIITIFPKGCINVHPSLLPRWRGSTPVQSSILHGDKITGVSIIDMNEKIDSGAIIYTKKCKISSKDTTSSLSLKLIEIGTQSLLEVLKQIVNNQVTKNKQNERYATISKKIYKKDAILNWNVDAEQLERLIRAFNPWPICFFIAQENIIKVWKATVIPVTQSNFSIGEVIQSNKDGIQINTAKNILNIQKLQFPGKRIMNTEDILASKKKWFYKGVIL